MNPVREEIGIIRAAAALCAGAGGVSFRIRGALAATADGAEHLLDLLPDAGPEDIGQQVCAYAEQLELARYILAEGGVRS